MGEAGSRSVEPAQFKVQPPVAIWAHAKRNRILALKLDRNEMQVTRQSNRSESDTGTIPLSLTIRPGCGLPGGCDCQTNSKALLRLRRVQTDLPSYALERFEESLRNQLGAKLMGVELSDTALRLLGYFID